MAQNVTIAGASYLGVPRIEMPKTGGGTAVFVDTSDANAAAGDITKGKTAYVGGAKITGTLEASSSGGAKETWIIKDNASGELVTTQISFTSNGQKFTSIGANYDGSGTFMILRYDNNEVAGWDISGGGAGFEFENEAYRKLTFDTPPTGALLTWLQSNATKQPDDTAVQDTKALTITSNGTVSVTPDAPYDALKKVDVTVNVSGGGGSSGGRLEHLSLSDIITSIRLEDVSCSYCDFFDGNYDFGDSSNVTFKFCSFVNSEVNCSQEIYDAIVNGENNDYSASSFTII